MKADFEFHLTSSSIVASIQLLIFKLPAIERIQNMFLYTFVPAQRNAQMM